MMEKGEVEVREVGVGGDGVVGDGERLGEGGGGGVESVEGGEEGVGREVVEGEVDGGGGGVG
ncbi:hypothetical protein, partial [Kocuria salsicia]|uniref:hypothetical protein n=1 Tax=Kocuria salsicia TaxID=664639 RepID=UPI001C93044E